MRSDRKSVGMFVATGLMVAALPAAAYAGGGNSVSEGCKTTRFDSLCIDQNVGSGGVYTNGNVAVYSSQEGRFQYKGKGPWVINHANGQIRCPRGTWCQRFFPAVLTAKGSSVSITTRRNGELFIGAIQQGGD